MEDWPSSSGILQTGCMANLQKHYHELLGLTDGWTVTKVELELADQRVQIDVDWTALSAKVVVRSGKMDSTVWGSRAAV